MMKNSPIGLLDSGVGGLSILAEIEKLLPNESSVFIADQTNVPYGGKTKEQLEGLVTNLVKFLVSKNVKLIVVACNTATVYTIDHLRSQFDLPIVGTVPVIKTLANITKTKKVGVMSTPATAKSPYLDDLIKKFAPDISVFKVGATHLEDLVEQGGLNRPEVEENLEHHLGILLDRGVDAIALGCTHYPFLRSKIEKIVGKNVAVVDSGGAVARRTKQILENENLLADKKVSEDLYFTTGDVEKFRRVAQELLKKDNLNVSKADL
jgi:glutamate racemase